MKILYVCSLSNFRHQGIKRKLWQLEEYYKKTEHYFEIRLTPADENKRIGYFSSPPREINNFDLVYARLVLPTRKWLKKDDLPPVIVERHILQKYSESNKDALRKLYEIKIRPDDFATALTYVTSEMKKIDNLVLPSIALGNFGAFSFTPRIRNLVTGRPIVGMSVGQFNESHGLDIFKKIAKELSTFDFQIAVSNERDYKYLQKYQVDNLRVCHARNENEYLSILSNWHCAVGPLAIWRKGIKEAAPLKVRDYVNLCIPTLLNFEDTNLNVENSSVIIQKPLNSNVGELVGAIQSLVFSKIDCDEFRTLSELVSVERVESKRLDFSLKILKSLP